MFEYQSFVTWKKKKHQNVIISNNSWKCRAIEQIDKYSLYKAVQRIFTNGLELKEN